MSTPLQSALAKGRVFARIAEFHPELTALRRELHAHPELGFEEVYTSSRVQQALQLCRVDSIHTGLGKTGVVGLIHGRGRRRSLLRPVGKSAPRCHRSGGFRPGSAQRQSAWWCGRRGRSRASSPRGWISSCTR